MFLILEFWLVGGPMDVFPNDSDGLALRKLAEAGIDMREPLNIEFHIHVDDERSGRAVADAVRNAGVSDDVEVVHDEGELLEGEEVSGDNIEFAPSWTVCVRVSLVPAYETVIDMQKTLDRVSKPTGGACDGWGVSYDRPDGL